MELYDERDNFCDAGLLGGDCEFSTSTCCGVYSDCDVCDTNTYREFEYPHSSESCINGYCDRLN